MEPGLALEGQAGPADTAWPKYNLVGLAPAVTEGERARPCIASIQRGGQVKGRLDHMLLQFTHALLHTTASYFVALCYILPHLTAFYCNIAQHQDTYNFDMLTFYDIAPCFTVCHRILAAFPQDLRT